MIPQKVKETWPVAKARQLLAELDLDHPCDMEIEDIAYARGVLVREGALDGADGWLTKIGGDGVIRVKHDIAERGRKRFTIAHELGHFELHQERDQFEFCADSEMSEYHSRPEEREASIFATELLLPEHLVRAACRTLKPGFADAKKIAASFQTTLTSAAMRYVQLTADRVALVACQDGRVKWYKASADFGYWFEPRTRLDAGTCAHDFFSEGEVLTEPTPIMASAWIKDRRVDPDAFMKEQCFALPRYKTVLSMIWMEKDIELGDY